MEEVRQLVQEEGREARNLVAFHVAVDAPATRVLRKPPRSVPIPATQSSVRRSSARPTASRLRSVSAGRDKKTELQARYWALLFGNLQRAIGEIYNTVEAHESLSECQEVVLVLENYTRDFKALCEWFRLKWHYDNTPTPHRPQSLAWEIRKTDFVKPESRKAHSVKSSPSVSGKNSPCLSGHHTPSGKNSPNFPTGKISPGSGKVSPGLTSSNIITSPKGSLEFFTNKISPSKLFSKAEPKDTIRLSDIKEKSTLDSNEFLHNSTPKTEAENVVTNDIKNDIDNQTNKNNLPCVEIGIAKVHTNESNPQQVVTIQSPRHSPIGAKKIAESTDKISTQAKMTVAKMDLMETNFIENQNIANKNIIKSDKASSEVVSASRAEKIKFIEEENINENQEKLSSRPSTEKKSIKISVIQTSKTDASQCNYIKEEIKHEENKNEENKIIIPEARDPSEGKTRNTSINEDITNATDRCLDNSQTAKSDVLEKNEENSINEVNENMIDAVGIKKLEKAVTDTKVTTSKPAYSQAAAKPKQNNTTISKSDTKITVKPNFVSVTKSVTTTDIKSKSSSKLGSSQKKGQVSRCSYPFNLTTGRSRLFDSVSSSKTSYNKRPEIRTNFRMASGDYLSGKINPKNVTVKQAQQKIYEKDKQMENVKSHLENIKNSENYISCDTLVTQIHLNRIESSDSLKTLVPDDFNDIANSVEILNIDNNMNDNDGWLTVKSRRFSRESKKHAKPHWSVRFNQPSATTSLPTLNMIEVPRIKNECNSKLHRAQSEQPDRVKIVVNTPIAHPKKVENKNLKSTSEIIRQNSDVTGMKTRTARNKALSKKIRSAIKSAESSTDLMKNRLHSSLENLTDGLSRSQERTEDPFDFDKWKSEFKANFKYFDEDDHIADHNEILKSADPSEMSEIAEMTSQIEENERKLSLALDFQSELDQRKLCEEEDSLNRQIQQLQQVSDVDLDTETDDTETDAEVLCEESTNLGDSECLALNNLASLAVSLEDQYEPALAGLSWAERIDTLATLEALVARYPGRAQQLHAKLSQGMRRRGSLQETLKRYQVKQARAEHQRLELQTERAKKIHQLLTRVEEVKVAKNQLIEEKRLRMERRLQKAAANRDQHIKDIVRKAHDEDEKLREIAFIKQLEAEHRRHDFLDQCRSHTARLRQMRRERLDKLEQKAAREAAVGARRLALEAARKQHVETLLERRKERDARVEELKEQKKQERDDAAREKAEGVKSRLSALAAAAELEADALRSRIRDKQDASQMRLEIHLQAIRSKAGCPRQQTLSESQEGQSTKESTPEEPAKSGLESARDRCKTLKKRAKKLRQKLISVGQEYENRNTPTVHEAHMNNGTVSRVLNQLSSILDQIYNNKINENCSENVKKKNRKRNDSDNVVVNGKENLIDEMQADKPEPNEITNCKKEKNRKKKNHILNDNNTNLSNSPKKCKAGKSNETLTSKASSITSSVSDVSRNCSSEMLQDVSHLERTLNELHRITENLNKDTKEQMVHYKIQALKQLGQLLSVVVDRDDIASVIPKRALVTSVTIINRIMNLCPLSTVYFINSNGSLHTTRLLLGKLEDDLSDPKEANFAKQLADCLSIALDSILCFTRLHGDPKKVVRLEERIREAKANNKPIEGQLQKEREDLNLTSALRMRAHMLINYICCCGSLSRVECAGDARGSLYTLLTTCADLCQPCVIDEGGDRGSALNALRAALARSLAGARAELCSLSALCAPAAAAGDKFVRTACITHLLRALSELDHTVVQEAFGEHCWALEFRAAAARLLTEHAPNDRDPPRSTINRRGDISFDTNLAEAMIIDLIVVIGFFVVNNPVHQESVCCGWSAIRSLCSLPANWFMSTPHRHALLPTLVALSEHPAAAQIISRELSLDMLENYLESPESQNVKLVKVIKDGRLKKKIALKKSLTAQSIEEI